MNEWWSLDEALDALPQLRGARRRVLRAAAAGRRRGRADAEGALAAPDLRRRGLPPARQRRRVRRDRARDQHQAGEVGRDPRGDPDGARGPRARARRHARLHDRVGARDRRRLRRRAALRPRRPGRQPPDRRRSVAGRRRSPTASRCRPRDRGSVSSKPERLLILAEGFSGDPHYGKTARGVLAYGERPVVAILDSTRAGETQGGVPIVGTVERRARATSRRRRSSASPRPGRPLPARLARAAAGPPSRAGLNVENGLHEFLRDDEELSELAARHGVELRDLRRPPADLNVPTGANLEQPTKNVLTVGSDCAIGKMTVSLELDRAAAAPRARVALRPDRPDRDRDRRLGDRRRRRRLRLHRGRGRAARRRGARARGRAALRRGPGRAHAPCLLGCDARPDPRLRAARVRPLPPGGGDGGRGLSRASAPAAARARRAARVDLAARTQGPRRGDRAEHARALRRRALAPRSPGPRRRRG